MDHENHETSENHETANANLYQAIPYLAKDIASDRVGNFRFFYKKIHKVIFFVKKEIKYHAAAGESGHYHAQTPGLQTYRVTPVI